MSSNREVVLNSLREGGVIAVLRANTVDQAVSIAEACLDGGISSIEVAYTIPSAQKVIEVLASKHPDACIGAGTVLDAETARISMLSGAKYIVSPYLDQDTMKICNRYRVPCLPGAMTIQEVVRALEMGADIIKLFPGELYGPKFIKAIRGPLPQAELMPTGGVSVDNVSEWLKAGAISLGVGGSLIGNGQDLKAIKNRAQQLVQEVQRVRKEIGNDFTYLR